MTLSVVDEHDDRSLPLSSTGQTPLVLVRSRNKLLQLLEPDALRRLAPKLRSTRLRSKQQLYAAGQPIDRVYFPEDSIISQLVVMDDGQTLETATVGAEGAAWICASPGAATMPCETIVSVGGTARVLEVSALDAELTTN